MKAQLKQKNQNRRFQFFFQIWYQNLCHQILIIFFNKIQALNLILIFLDKPIFALKNYHNFNHVEIKADKT